MTAYHIGIDLHKSVAQVCVCNAQGDVEAERRFQLPDRAAGAALVAWLAEYGASGRFAVEALGCNRWFVNACREAGLEILVVHAADLGLKNTGKKTDRRDAREIARRLHLGDLDRHAKTYFPTEREYGWRKVLRVRHKLVSKRTSLQAEIRGLLNAHLIRPPKGALHGEAQIDWLEDLDLGESSQTLVLHALAAALRALQLQIARLTQEIKRLAGEEATARWIAEHLPQAGPQTALALRAELGDAKRFRGARQAASYAGVVPRVTASADRSHHGRITRRGNAELRWILGQWAVRLLAFNDTVKTWAAPMLKRMHRNKVRTALARRLLVGVYVMFSRGEIFSLERCLGRPA
jgi:transposase